MRGREWDARGREGALTNLAIILSRALEPVGKATWKINRKNKTGDGFARGSGSGARGSRAKRPWSGFGIAVALAAMSLGGCTSAAYQSPASASEVVQVARDDRWQLRWDDPVRDNSRFTRELPRTDAFAISADGEWIALPSPFEISNGLMVFKWRTLEGFTLRYPISSLELIDPAFAPDQKKLALVATPAPRYGWSEIWVVDLRGRLIDRVPGCERSYRKPTFSSDGRHLGFFTDLWGSADTNVVQPQRAPELRAWHNSSVIFEEFDFNRRVQSRPAQLGWGLASWAQYSSDGQSVIVRAVSPLEPQVFGGTRREWSAIGPNLIADRVREGGGTRDEFDAGVRISGLRSAAVSIEPVKGLADGVGLLRDQILRLSPGPVGDKYHNTSVAGDVLSVGFGPTAEALISIPHNHVRHFLPVVSANACVVAYPLREGSWTSGSGEPMEQLRIVDLCNSQREHMLRIEEIMRKLPPVTADWRFGEACKLD